MSLIQLKNVKYTYRNSYNSNEVLKGISCDFEQGKVYALVGKSGSGKTTLLSLLAGLDTPQSGEVLYNGKATAKSNLTQYRRENVSVIYQSFRLFPLLTVLENVMYPMELRKVKAKKAREDAKKYIMSVDLGEEKFDRFPNMLSGGEQQRVAIARSLAMHTNLLLADEPTGNLDKANSDNIVQLLRRLAHEQNYCVIIVTHDHAIRNIADIVYTMEDGRLVSGVANELNSSDMEE